MGDSIAHWVQAGCALIMVALAFFGGLWTQAWKLSREIELRDEKMRGIINERETKIVASIDALRNDIGLRLDNMQKDSEAGRRRLYEHADRMHQDNRTDHQALSGRVGALEVGVAKIEGSLNPVSPPRILGVT